MTGSMRYRRGARVVDAILFDGSSASAAEISARFSGAVGHDRGQIEVATSFGRVYAGMGCWVVRDCATRQLSVVDDREFSGHFEVVDGEDLPPLDRRSFARTPDHRWGVA